MLIGPYGLWHGAVIMSERRMDLGFLVSNDGIHFREPVADHIFIPAGRDGEWDRRGLVHGQGFENVGDRTYIFCRPFQFLQEFAEDAERTVQDFFSARCAASCKIQIPAKPELGNGSRLAGFDRVNFPGADHSLIGEIPNKFHG